MDKISVIIPTYNRAHLILDSINSVLNQTYKNLEVIVVDDGSTDNTEEVVKSLNDERVKYIKYKKNQGACHARNVGIESSTGKYIAFQDSDDIFHEDKLEKQLENLKNNKSDLDFCKIKIYEEGIENIVPNVVQESSIINNKIIEELCNANFISTQAILIKKNILNNNLFDETLPRLQDYDLVLRVIEKIKISYTNIILVDLYRQNDSISSSYEKLKSACLMMIKKNYKLEKIYNEKLIDTLLRWINIPLNNNYERELESLKKEKEEAIKQNKIINDKLSECQNIINNLENNNKLNEEKIIRKNEIILQKDIQIDSIINSKSWKYVSFIRNIKNKLFFRKKK